MLLSINDRDTLSLNKYTPQSANHLANLSFSMEHHNYYTNPKMEQCLTYLQVSGSNPGYTLEIFVDI